MAAVTRPQKHVTNAPQQLNAGLSLIWLDDTAEEEPQVKAVLATMYDNVFIFSDPEACLELVQANENKPPCLSILISGKYGQLLVGDHLQPLNQVKDIYVFCFDTVKHGRWAQTCDKVRCVFSDINKIVQCMQYDLQNIQEEEQQPIDIDDEQEPSSPSPMAATTTEDQENLPVEIKQQRERFTDDLNLFDQLALNLLLETPQDGKEDFNTFCEKQYENEFNQPIGEWYNPNLSFTQINSNNLTHLWILRWFIRLFYQQLKTEHEKFIVDKSKFVVNHGTWLSTDELDAMKHRISQNIIITELLTGFIHQQTALDSLQSQDGYQHKVIFEILVDPTVHNTIPYAEIKPDEILLWFGGRYRLIKVEYVEHDEPYWIIGLKLLPTLNPKTSLEILYNYYFKELKSLNNLHHAFGRLFMYKGAYFQAEQWLQIDNQYIELAELSLRQGRFAQTKIYLENLPDDCDDANILRAFLNILTSIDNFSKSRLLLMQIFSEATDKFIRARVNLSLGFINLILTQQIDQAFEHFNLAHEVLRKLLPDCHPFLVKSYLGLGYTYYAQRKLEEARQCFENAFQIQAQLLPFDHPDFAQTRSARAHCLSTDKQKLGQALNESEYALNILIDAFPNNRQHHPEILATKHDIERLKKGKELRPRNTLLNYI